MKKGRAGFRVLPVPTLLYIFFDIEIIYVLNSIIYRYTYIDIHTYTCTLTFRAGSVEVTTLLLAYLVMSINYCNYRMSIS